MAEDKVAKNGEQRPGSNQEKEGLSQSDSQKTRVNNVLHKSINLQSYKQDEEGVKASAIFYPFCKPGYNLLFGSQHVYIFLRQFYTIYERLMKAREIIDEKISEELKLPKNESLQGMSAAIKQETFDVFYGVVLAATTSVDANQYEDLTRQILGSKAYLLFAFDKLINQVT